MKSNFQAVKNHWVHKPDRLLDRSDWSYKKANELPRRAAGTRKPLPTPYEVAVAMKARLFIANKERESWEQAQRAKAIAAVKADYLAAI
jgi:hypothetical protein